MKQICILCKVEKDYEDFAKHKTSSSGKNSYCKECMREYSKKYRKDNKDKIKKYLEETKEERQNKNKERFTVLYSSISYKEEHLANGARWRKDRRAIYKKGQMAWRKANPIKMASYSAYHRARRKNAIPSWVSELDTFVFEEAYSLRKLRLDATGILWEVDHIIPITGRKVCGLHVWNNLQVIPAAANRSKHNKYEV